MIQYNVDYLYVALGIMVLIGINYLLSKRNHLVGHRVFSFFLAVVLIDALLDLITCYQISGANLKYWWLSNLCMILFYICQITIPYMFLIYSARVTREDDGRLDKLTRALVFPTAFLVLMAILNPLTHALFTFDKQGAYYHGPLYILIYIQVFVYVFVVLVRILRRRKEDRKTANTFLAYIIINLATVFYQYSHPYVMTTSLGLALGLMIMYITISNPDAFVDYMTKAFNRRGLVIWLGRRRKPCYVIAFSFPNMSKMNQVYGVSAVNALLKQIVIWLNDEFKLQTFRISNTKFLSVAENKTQAEAVKAWMDKRFKSTVSVEDIVFSCFVQSCVAYMDEEILSGDLAMEYCDFLLRRAERKEERPSGTMEQLKERFLYEQEVERYLITAVDEDLFEIYMQPIYSAEKKRFTAVEVLSRLNHPDLGMIQPDLFIDLAEKNGSVDKITWLQFHRLCNFMQDNPDIMEQLDSVKFNLSPHELIAHDYDVVLPNIIREHNLPVEKFEFEITETAATEYCSSMQKFISVLQQQGIRLNMDDFGSGYANFSDVLKLSFTYIKMDRSLLQDITYDEQAATLYQGLVETFHKLGFQVISEGVETKEEYEMVTGWGIHLLQGYYFSKPVPSEEIRGILCKEVIC